MWRTPLETSVNVRGLPTDLDTGAEKPHLPGDCLARGKEFDDGENRTFRKRSARRSASLNGFPVSDEH